MLIPLEVLPRGLEVAGRLLPMMAVAYAPARLAAGHREPGLLLIQLAWLVIGSATAAWLFARGERHLRRVGA
jgi:ABC-type uncharacterized transport system permease subunit